MNTNLIWSPLHEPIAAHCKSGDSLLLLISPFIGLEALERFIESAGCDRGLKVIVRWRPEDLRSGVSDVAIFPYLAARGIALYVNPDIHLKLFVFESNLAFNTSGNLTLRGLGYSENANIEAGTFVQLAGQDWSKIFQLINSSRQVDEDLYQRYKRYVDSCPKPLSAAGPPLDLGSVSKTYTISSLPAMETPVDLGAYYFSPSRNDYSPEVVRRAAHDLITFGVPPGLNRSDFDNQLGKSFRLTPFVVEFVAVLKTEKSLRFGAVNDWIHEKCEDVPLPYRWEIKENTRIFYNWLQHFFPEITWDRPNYSQVIYWQGQ
jgi:hypothetical protein